MRTKVISDISRPHPLYDTTMGIVNPFPGTMADRHKKPGGQPVITQITRPS
jgi:hypothetical protein